MIQYERIRHNCLFLSRRLKDIEMIKKGEEETCCDSPWLRARLITRRRLNHSVKDELEAIRRWEIAIR